MEAIFKKELFINKAICRVLGVFMFVILMSLGAFVRIPLPFTPVPLTLQTFFVLLGACFLGRNLSVLTQLSYLLLGIVGLPIFTGAGSGLLYLSGPTAGYLAGFIVASIFVAQSLKIAKNTFLSTFFILYFASLLILGCGVVWLKVIFPATSLANLFYIGFLPFLIGDLFKALTATILYLKLRPRAKEIFS